MNRLIDSRISNMIFNHFDNKKSFDLSIMFLFPFLASALTLIFKTNLFVSTLLFFGLPALYISLRNLSIIAKSVIFSMIVSFPLSLFIDVFAAKDGSWVIPRSIFPFKFFGVATMEVYVFGLLWVLSLILFYEHFIDRGGSGDKLPKNIKYLEYLSAFLISITAIIYLFEKSLIVIPYFYLLIGILIVILPLSVFLYYNRKFTVHIFDKFFKLGLYFFILMLLFELVAVHTGQWIFPGNHFIGWVELWGLRFPFEEFFMWMILASPAMIAYYEYFADDKR